jgi:hypothetical protein
MITTKIAYWDKVSYTSCDSEIKIIEDLSAETEDALFEAFYKLNNSLRYCNGSYYQFVNAVDETNYYKWRQNLSHERSFGLYYGGGVVD